MKFLGREFWSAIFGKQANALRTNHQGIYDLIDDKFRFIRQMTDSQQYINQLGKVMQQKDQIRQSINFFIFIIVFSVFMWIDSRSFVEFRYQFRCKSRNRTTSMRQISNSNPYAVLIFVQSKLIIFKHIILFVIIKN
ncbi:hypothetical protein SSS_10773 [Sarcoptes scabiei]|nr:hypothetical protein SSS_10773 [Sarcoptes scabiei]